MGKVTNQSRICSPGRSCEKSLHHLLGRLSLGLPTRVMQCISKALDRPPAKKSRRDMYDTRKEGMRTIYLRVQRLVSLLDAASSFVSWSCCAFAVSDEMLRLLFAGLWRSRRGSVIYWEGSSRLYLGLESVPSSPGQYY